MTDVAHLLLVWAGACAAAYLAAGLLSFVLLPAVPPARRAAWTLLAVMRRGGWPHWKRWAALLLCFLVAWPRLLRGGPMRGE